MTTSPGFLRRRDVLKGAALATGGLAFPLISKAQAVTPNPIIINPNGQDFIDNFVKYKQIGGMYVHPTNPNIYLCDMPDPTGGILKWHSRLTFAVDVCAVDGYYSNPQSHIVVAARANPNDVIDKFGGSAWQGTIAGLGAASVFSERRMFNSVLVGNTEYDALDRPTGILVPPDKGWQTAANAIVPHHWYRFVVDSVKWQGQRMYECRVYDVIGELSNTLGALLYRSPSLYFPDVGYADTNTVMFANVSGSISSLIVGRVAAYWTHATEWVANP